MTAMLPPRRHTLVVLLTALLIGGCSGTTSTTPSPQTTAAARSCGQSFENAAAPAGYVRVGALGLHPAPAGAATELSRFVTVRFAGGALSPQAQAVLTRLGAQTIGPPNPHGAQAFILRPGVDPLRAADALRGVPGVLAAGPVAYRYPLGVPQFPDDPLFNKLNQWDMFAINMPAAWGISEGSPSVRIAVIDTGYDTHNPDLAGKVDDAVVFDLGTGQPDEACTVQDNDGHGTDVSGLAAADTNNLTDVSGVGWNVHLLEARVFPYGNNTAASTIDIAAAIDWAVQHGAKVINLSLGSGTPDPVYEEPAVAAALKAGVTVVAAAGNDGQDLIDYPAADPGVIAVGASAICGDTPNTPGTGAECVASYSNYGPQLALVAPGGNGQKNCTTQSCVDYLQWIENLDSTTGPFREQVGLFAGTSQATPHVSGAAALLLSVDPALTPAQVRSTLMSTADNIGSPHQGAGRLDVDRALAAVP